MKRRRYSAGQIEEAFLIIQENLIFLMKEEGEFKPVKI
jgi:hypothetical protein